jgi:hypothetical protein
VAKREKIHEKHQLHRFASRPWQIEFFFNNQGSYCGSVVKRAKINEKQQQEEARITPQP